VNKQDQPRETFRDVTRVKVETYRHKMAFEYWVGLGPSRSFAAVARKYGVSTTAVQHWSVSFNWRDRLPEQPLPTIEDIVLANSPINQIVAEPDKIHYRCEVQQVRGIIVAMIREFVTVNPDGSMSPKFRTRNAAEAMRVIKAYNEIVRLDLDIAKALQKGGEEETEKKDLFNKITNEEALGILLGDKRTTDELARRIETADYQEIHRGRPENLHGRVSAHDGAEGAESWDEEDM